MSQDNLVRVQCTDCKKGVYNTFKNKKKIKEKLELSKHCAFCRKHTKHIELKGK